MKLVSGLVDSGFFAQSALSAEVATKDSLGRNISETYLTAVDIPESAVWNATTQTVSANSAQWAGGTANPQIPVTSTSGISIFESGDKVYFNISADYALTDDLTGKQDSLTFGYKDTAISSIDNSAIYDNSAHARITTLAGRISDLSSNKLDTTAFSDVSGSFLTAVPDTYLQNTDLTITDGKITEISGVPLSAGDELPSGVMNTSGLEYNAVNEISGYNGSAIAQYGAEKQWLVHDDTLVHAANSAQYALGVNLSAVAQLLGVDETVLWENTGTTAVTSMTLSEDVRNFDRFRVYWLWNNGTDFISRSDEFSNFYTDTTHRAFGLDGLYRYDGTSFTVYSRFVLDTSYSSITYEYSNQNSDTAKYIVVNKIVGIGRKQ